MEEGSQATSFGCPSGARIVTELLSSQHQPMIGAFILANEAAQIDEIVVRTVIEKLGFLRLWNVISPSECPRHTESNSWITPIIFGIGDVGNRPVEATEGVW